MFGVGDSILILFAVIFSLGVFTLDFSIFERLKRRAVEAIADQFGLYDVYFELCSTQSLEMIRSLRHYEGAYCESLVEFVAETLSLPEMLLMLAVSWVQASLKIKTNFPTLTDQAQRVALFHVDVVKYRLRHASPPSGPYAHRFCSRWRRREN